jgi:hypothetical protein
VFVDNGLLRKGEREAVESLYARNFKIDLRVVDASALFLKRLKGVTEPETKRKIIGRTFVEVFEKSLKSIGGAQFLAQGTLYPDVIESVSIGGNPASLIKTHHNVGGLPERMKLKLLEPLRELFKDEVRQRRRAALGLPQGSRLAPAVPRPGPRGPRVMGDITADKLEILRNADAVLAGGDDEVRPLLEGLAVLLPYSCRSRPSGVVRRRAHLRLRHRPAHRGEHRRHDRRLGAPPARLAAENLQPHHQRGARGQPRGLGHQFQAAGDHRMGISSAHPLLALPVPGYPVFHHSQPLPT